MFSCLISKRLKCQNKGRISIKNEEPRSMPLRVSAEALFCLQQIVQKVHALYLLLEIGAPIDIQRE